MNNNDYYEILKSEKQADQIIIDSLEKKVYDLRNLIEIGMSLSSNLNFKKLIDAVLYSCIGQLFIEKIAILLQVDLDENNYYVHTSKGYDNQRTKKKQTLIDEKSNLLKFLNDYPTPHFYEDLKKDERLAESLKDIENFEPEVIVPMKSKNALNGIIILGSKMTGEKISKDEKEFLKGLAKFAAITVENSRLYHMATLDRMTRLYIHHYFQEKLKDEIKRHNRSNSPLSLIITDIDHFKNFNDTYGHQQGDIVIKETAKIVKENVREDIDLAARYGGEEFAIILPETDLEGAVKLASRLRKLVESKKYPGQEKDLHVTISIGVAQYNKEKNENSKNLIERADKALYKAKESGRNRVVASK